MSKHQFISKEGQQVPDVAFKTRDNYEWGAVQSKDLFAGRNVVVFSLPGAFTPTCSSTHVPRFNELASVFKQEGIDEIVCLSVNDPFVMQAWAKDQEAENIRIGDEGGPDRLCHFGSGGRHHRPCNRAFKLSMDCLQIRLHQEVGKRAI